MVATAIKSGGATSGGWEPQTRIDKDELVRISDEVLAEPDIEFTELEDVFVFTQMVSTGISETLSMNQKRHCKLQRGLTVKS